MQIPIQNIWWMMLYASDLGEAKNKSLLSIEDLPEDIPDLIGVILSKTVENRLRRQLTFSFQACNKFLLFVLLFLKNPLSYLSENQ